MTPAEITFEAFGGIRATARAIGRSPGAVHNWKKPTKEHGCGGDLPSPKMQRKVLKEAKKRGIRISESELIWGR